MYRQGMYRGELFAIRDYLKSRPYDPVTAFAVVMATNQINYSHDASGKIVSEGKPCIWLRPWLDKKGIE